MVAVFIMVSILAGLTASSISLLMGSSVLVALAWYVAAGAATLVTFPAGAAVVGATRARRSRLHGRGHMVIEPQAPATTVPSDETVATSMRILAVDDDPFVLELVPKIAENAGFDDVTTVSSGAEALGLLSTPDQAFDCLLLDIKMPGMDGIELCRKVRDIEGYQTTPIIMLTAMRDLTSMDDAFRAGASDYATKPFVVEELGRRLQLADASNQACQDQTSTLRKSTGFKELQTAKTGFDIDLDTPMSGAKTLVQEAVVLNYMTQLPNKLLDDVHVYALSIVDLDMIQSAAQPHEYLTLLDDVAAAAERCIGANLLLTAYSDFANLLMIVDSASRLAPDHLETEIKRQLVAVGAVYGAHEAASIQLVVGGPVVPSGSGEKGARSTFDTAVSLSASRLPAPQVRSAVGVGTH